MKNKSGITSLILALISLMLFLLLFYKSAGMFLAGMYALSLIGGTLIISLGSIITGIISIKKNKANIIGIIGIILSIIVLIMTLLSFLSPIS